MTEDLPMLITTRTSLLVYRLEYLLFSVYFYRFSTLNFYSKGGENLHPILAYTSTMLSLLFSFWWVLELFPSMVFRVCRNPDFMWELVDIFYEELRLCVIIIDSTIGNFSIVFSRFYMQTFLNCPKIQKKKWILRV